MLCPFSSFPGQEARPTAVCMYPFRFQQKTSQHISIGLLLQEARAPHGLWQIESVRVEVAIIIYQEDIEKKAN